MVEAVMIGACPKLHARMYNLSQKDIAELQEKVQNEIQYFLNAPEYPAVLFAKRLADMYGSEDTPVVASAIVGNDGHILFVFLDMVDITVKQKFQYILQLPQVQ